MIDDYLAQTDVGKVMLETDLQLKKDAASFTSPQTSEGREYWNKLYQKAQELYGSGNITIPTLTRPWIVPDEIIIRETADSAYIYKATLKVMLEQDYLKNDVVYNFKDEKQKQLNDYSSQLIRALIIPKLTREVNTSKRYASLRQVYYSLTMAQWFKSRFLGRGGIYASLIDQRNLTGLTSTVSWSKIEYFGAYQKSFKDGEYNINEPVQTPFGQTIRSYFSGGAILSEAMPAPGETRVDPQTGANIGSVIGSPQLSPGLPDKNIPVSGQASVGSPVSDVRAGAMPEEIEPVARSIPLVSLPTTPATSAAKTPEEKALIPLAWKIHLVTQAGAKGPNMEDGVDITKAGSFEQLPPRIQKDNLSAARKCQEILAGLKVDIEKVRDALSETLKRLKDGWKLDDAYGTTEARQAVLDAGIQLHELWLARQQREGQAVEADRRGGFFALSAQQQLLDLAVFETALSARRPSWLSAFTSAKRASDKEYAKDRVQIILNGKSLVARVNALRELSSRLLAGFGEYEDTQKTVNKLASDLERLIVEYSLSHRQELPIEAEAREKEARKRQEENSLIGEALTALSNCAHNGGSLAAEALSGVFLNESVDSIYRADAFRKLKQAADNGNKAAQRAVQRDIPALEGPVLNGDLQLLSELGELARHGNRQAADIMVRIARGTEKEELRQAIVSKLKTNQSLGNDDGRVLAREALASIDSGQAQEPTMATGEEAWVGASDSAALEQEKEKIRQKATRALGRNPTDEEFAVIWQAHRTEKEGEQGELGEPDEDGIYRNSTLSEGTIFMKLRVVMSAKKAGADERLFTNEQVQRLGDFGAMGIERRRAGLPEQGAVAEVDTPAQKDSLKIALLQDAQGLGDNPELYNAFVHSVDILRDITEGRHAEDWELDQAQRVIWHGFTHAANNTHQMILAMQNFRRDNPNVPVEAIVLGAIAGMYHDVGYYQEDRFGTTKVDHELRSMQFVKKYAAELGLRPQDVGLACMVISATQAKVPAGYWNNLETMIRDKNIEKLKDSLREFLSEEDAEDIAKNKQDLLLGLIYCAKFLLMLDVRDTREDALERQEDLHQEFKYDYRRLMFTLKITDAETAEDITDAEIENFVRHVRDIRAKASDNPQLSQSLVEEEVLRMARSDMDEKDKLAARSELLKIVLSFSHAEAIANSELFYRGYVDKWRVEPFGDLWERYIDPVAQKRFSDDRKLVQQMFDLMSAGKLTAQDIIPGRRLTRAEIVALVNRTSTPSLTLEPIRSFYSGPSMTRQDMVVLRKSRSGEPLTAEELEKKRAWDERNELVWESSFGLMGASDTEIFILKRTPLGSNSLNISITTSKGKSVGKVNIVNHGDSLELIGPFVDTNYRRHGLAREMMRMVYDYVRTHPDINSLYIKIDTSEEDETRNNDAQIIKAMYRALPLIRHDMSMGLKKMITTIMYALDPAVAGWNPNEEALKVFNEQARDTLKSHLLRDAGFSKNMHFELTSENEIVLRASKDSTEPATAGSSEEAQIRQRATRALGREPTDEEFAAIWKAHLTEAPGEQGELGEADEDGIYRNSTYSQETRFRKTRALMSATKAGTSERLFTNEQVQRLGDFGAMGTERRQAAREEHRFVSDAKKVWQLWSNGRGLSAMPGRQVVAEGSQEELFAAVDNVWKLVRPGKNQGVIADVIGLLLENVRQHAGDYGVLFVKFDEANSKVYVAVMDRAQNNIYGQYRDGQFVQRDDSPGKGIALNEKIQKPQVEKLRFYTSEGIIFAVGDKDTQGEEGFEGIEGKGTLAFAVINIAAEGPVEISGGEPVAGFEDKLRQIDEVYQKLLDEEFGEGGAFYSYMDATGGGNFAPADIRTAAEALRRSGLSPGKKFVDLGTGDMRVPVIAAVLFGAKAVGVEKNPTVISIAKEALKRLERSGIIRPGQVELVEGNIFDYPVNDADVVFYYEGSGSGTASVERKLLKELSRPGAQVVLYGYLGEDMGFLGLEPQLDYQGRNSVRIYRVPGQAPGGIDFRSLPITTQPLINAPGLGFSSQKIIPNASLDKEWGDIENMLNKGIIPSIERIREYLFASCSSQDCQARAEQALNCIADILRMEEDTCSPTEGALKQLLVLIESNKPAKELKTCLLNLQVTPKELESFGR
jgi:hypothetical protein